MVPSPHADRHTRSKPGLPGRLLGNLAHLPHRLFDRRQLVRLKTNQLQKFLRPIQLRDLHHPVKCDRSRIGEHLFRTQLVQEPFLTVDELPGFFVQLGTVIPYPLELGV